MLVVLVHDNPHGYYRRIRCGPSIGRLCDLTPGREVCLGTFRIADSNRGTCRGEKAQLLQPSSTAEPWLNMCLAFRRSCSVLFKGVAVAFQGFLLLKSKR